MILMKLGLSFVHKCTLSTFYNYLLGIQTLNEFQFYPIRQPTCIAQNLLIRQFDLIEKNCALKGEFSILKVTFPISNSP